MQRSLGGSLIWQLQKVYIARSRTSYKLTSVQHSPMLIAELPVHK